MDQPKVFLSYSHQDSTFAKRLVEDLEKAGAEVWYDISGIDSGDFLKRIDDALRNCGWLVLILTPSAIASSYVTTEVNAGLHRVHQERMRAVIPVLAAPCAPDSIPTLWDMQHRFDAVADYAAALAGLCRALGLASTPSAPPAGTQPAERPSNQVSRSQAPAPQPAVSADDLVTQGKALEAKNRYYEAYLKFDQATRLAPNHFDAWYCKGQAICGFGGVEILSRSLDMHLVLEEALEAAERAVSLKPNHAGAWWLKHDALEGLGRRDEAIKAGKRSVELAKEARQGR